MARKKIENCTLCGIALNGYRYFGLARCRPCAVSVLKEIHHRDRGHVGGVGHRGRPVDLCKRIDGVIDRETKVFASRLESALRSVFLLLGVKECSIHGQVEPVHREGNALCPSCYQNRVKRRTENKRELRASDGAYKASFVAYQRSRRNSNRERISAIKLERGCLSCGYRGCVQALHFDHRNPLEKSFNISLSRDKSWDTIMAEIDKCDVLCANCHAKKTFESGHSRLRFDGGPKNKQRPKMGLRLVAS